MEGGHASLKSTQSRKRCVRGFLYNMESYINMVLLTASASVVRHPGVGLLEAVVGYVHGGMKTAEQRVLVRAGETQTKKLVV